MIKPSAEENKALADDICQAVHLLLQNDSSRTALPNRLLYDLIAESDRRTGELKQQEPRNMHFDIDFHGSLRNAGLNTLRTFGQHGCFENGQAAVLFRVIDEHLERQGQDFTPKFVGWKTHRNERLAQESSTPGLGRRNFPQP